MPGAWMIDVCRVSREPCGALRVDEHFEAQHAEEGQQLLKAHRAGVELHVGHAALADAKALGQLHLGNARRLASGLEQYAEL
ncbi:hypothetical protein D9M68_899060 [compost metagenome]